jgi:hypothetical protein
MEDKTRALIVTGAVLLLILALIIAAIFYLIRFIQGRTSTRTPSPTPTTQINFSPSPAGQPNQPTGNQGTPPTGDTANTKAYNGIGFQLTYPKNWGLLTCNNSQNIEFDPYNSTDQLRVACDWAQKPVTVMVGVSCEGNATSIGSVPVVKSQRQLSKGVEYSWCVKAGSTHLLFTNRVSNQDARGYGKDNQSAAIEQIISRIRIGQAS